MAAWGPREEARTRPRRDASVGVVGPTRATRLSVRRRGRRPPTEKDLCLLVQQCVYCPKMTRPGRTPGTRYNILFFYTIPSQILGVALIGRSTHCPGLAAGGRSSP